MNKQKPVSFTHPQSLTCKRWQLAKLLDMFLSKWPLLVGSSQKRWVIQLGVEADTAQLSPRSTTEFSFTKNTSNLEKNKLSKGPYPNFSPAFSKGKPPGGSLPLCQKHWWPLFPPKKNGVTAPTSHETHASSPGQNLTKVPLENRVFFSVVNGIFEGGGRCFFKGNISSSCPQKSMGLWYLYLHLPSKFNHSCW